MARLETQIALTALVRRLADPTLVNSIPVPPQPRPARPLPPARRPELNTAFEHRHGARARQVAARVAPQRSGDRPLGSPRPTGPDLHGGQHGGINRERLVRTLTFWLRPAFALRVINRFQKIVGFDRSMALASSALTFWSLSTSSAPSSATSCTTTPQSGSSSATTSPERAPRSSSCRRHQCERGHLRGRVSDDLGAEFRASRAAALRTDVGTQASQRAQHAQRPVVDLTGGYGVVAATLRVLGGGALGLAASVCQVPVTAAFLVWSGRILSGEADQPGPANPPPSASPPPF